jgi:type II secretory pathway pseudopilin PulG
MKLRPSIPRSAFRTPRSDRAFTMVEIALSLAIIGFALVAIIGVLPAGMSVQKDNREQTVINLDAAYLMDALRSGPLGQDNLTNYIVSITQSNTLYNGSPLARSASVVNIFTNTGTLLNGTASGPCLTSGFNIIGLLSTPKYILVANSVPPPLVVGLWSNSVTAIFRAINAPAVDQGVSQASKDFAFQYQVTIEIVPTADYAFLAINNGSWFNLTAPAAVSAAGISTNDETLAQHLQANLYDLRLTFRWPVLGNGQLGGGKQVFRSSVAGTYLTQSPQFPPLPSGFRYPLPLSASYVLANGASLYLMQGLTYTARTP